MEVITRFAPSSTGHLHLGHAYSAWLGWQRARISGGSFLVRLEDIDTPRCKPEYVDSILEDLRWLGLEWDGDVRLQSDFLPDYSNAISKLHARGVLYPCFCSRSEIARALAAPHGGERKYPGTCRHMSLAERNARLANGDNYALRLNVELALEFEGVPRRARAARVETVLKLVALDDVHGYRPRQLSGGMKMRVSIARALVTTPRLLLMDEPFGALDAMTRNRLNEELLALHARQQWTTLFVTHSITEAVFLSDRILLMGANPGGVLEEIAVNLPSPRTAALRIEPKFLDLVGQVSRALAAIHP